MLKITASIKYTMNKNVFSINFVYYPVGFEVNFAVCRNADGIKFRRDMTPFREFFKGIAGFFNLFENMVRISSRIVSYYILINIKDVILCLGNNNYCIFQCCSFIRDRISLNAFFIGL